MKDVTKIIQWKNKIYDMIKNNEITETQIFSGIGLLNQIHLTFHYIVVAVIFL